MTESQSVLRSFGIVLAYYCHVSECLLSEIPEKASESFLSEVFLPKLYGPKVIHLNVYYQPANLKNFCVSGGRSGEMLDTDDCLDGLAGPPGDKGPGLNGGHRSREDADPCSCASVFFSLSWASSLSELCTRKNASTAGCSTRTAFASEVSANSVKHSPERKTDNDSDTNYLANKFSGK